MFIGDSQRILDATGDSIEYTMHDVQCLHSVYFLIHEAFSGR